jgi:glutaredoxin 3
VEQLIASEKVLIYSKSYCPYSSETKELLQQKGVATKVIELNQIQNGKEIQNILRIITG